MRRKGTKAEKEGREQGRKENNKQKKGTKGEKEAREQGRKGYKRQEGRKGTQD